MRMIEWLIVSLLLVGLIWLTAPQQLPVSLYKLSLITMAAWMAYWIDRSAFPYARPDRAATGIERAGAQIRRAIIVGSAMLAVSLGV